MGEACYWVCDEEVGRFLVPGCWSRAVGGDGAPCHCESRAERLSLRVSELEQQLAELRERPND